MPTCLAVSGKNASLGEMVRELAPQGVRVPNGFAITAAAYRHVLDQADAWPRLHRALDGLNARNVNDLARRAQLAREVIFGAALPADLVAEVSAAYARLQAEYGEHATVAVRSSASAEDLPTASFAGQHETYLNVYRRSCSMPCAAVSRVWSPTGALATASTTASTISRSSNRPPALDFEDGGTGVYQILASRPNGGKWPVPLSRESVQNCR